MATDLHCAELCAAIYDEGMAGYFDHLDMGKDDSICWGMVRTQGPDIVVFRGSKTVDDWIRDLIALASPFSDFALGPVHPGFLLGMEHAWSDIHPLLTSSGGPPILTGHSLGAARAAILCGLMVLKGPTPGRLVTFGSPKPGFAQLASIISKVPAASYRNTFNGQHDLVTDLPFSFPPEEYVHPDVLVDVAAAPEPGDPLGIFALHHVQLYQEALRKLGSEPEGKES